MKINSVLWNIKYAKIILLAVFIFFSYAYSARLTVFNATQDTQDVTVHAAENSIYTARIKPNTSHIFNSWTKPFVMLVWKALIQETGAVRSGQPLYKEGHKADIPSSTSMLTGLINIWPGGNYGINFDKNGASDKKVRNLKGSNLE